MTKTKLMVNEIVDPLSARVIIDPAAASADRVATFDVAGVPRVDTFLEGKPAWQVPTMVTRLCGLCPVTHHLAGMRALDQLCPTQPDEAARALRLLLHHGSVLDVMGPRLALKQSRAAAVAVRTMGKKAQALAGAPGHFPDVATPGGVKPSALPLKEQATQLRAQILDLYEQTRPIIDGLIAECPPQQPLEQYRGADIIVADASGAWDPLGDFLLIRLSEPGLAPSDGHATLKRSELIPAAEVAHRLRETAPGAITPRPEVLIDGAWHPYRVGPAARYPQYGAARAQAQSLADSAAAIAQLSAGLGDDIFADAEEASGHQAPVLADGVGTGLVDGPRGLLIHHYEVKDGVLARCQILSPTAQNEPWLAEMLSRAWVEFGPVPQLKPVMEQAVRAADPCLPCTQAPEGMMNLAVVDEDGNTLV